ncbi:hypothetical protein OS493_009148 [Desmophyllum pertusum]|uniref:Uncharacterized protein n=1 Tax=Desmophyllum pertusum TaxID=174260 RepID=A0A9X0CSG2_9CNID|nr:hypothetical protein OS493_009148 [Desmophyllum pertusum]
MFTLVSSRPAPELSLEEIEKELEQLTANENDASDTIKKTSDQADTAAKQTQSDVPKEIADKTNDVTKETLEALDKSVTETEQKKDETTKTEAATDKKTADASAFPAEPVKPALPEIPHRDATESGMRSESDLPSHHLPKMSLKDTAAYKRLMAEVDKSRLRDEYKPYDYPPKPPPQFRHPEAPARRTFDGYYHKSYDYPPSGDSSWNRRGFLPYSDPIETLRARGIPINDMTRTERMSLKGGTWLPDSDPVKVPARIPLPVHPDVGGRSYNDVHKQLNDKEMEDLIHGKSGLTDVEKRKRLLMDLLAEKLKSKVNEAQKRGLKIPTKIMDFLWDYKNRLSH